MVHDEPIIRPQTDFTPGSGSAYRYPTDSQPDEPIIRPQSDFTTGTGTAYRYPTDLQPDEPIIGPQSGTDAGWERNEHGHWAQASSDSRYAAEDITPDGTTVVGGGWERNAKGHWTQAGSRNQDGDDDISLHGGSNRSEDYDQ